MLSAGIIVISIAALSAGLYWLRSDVEFQADEIVSSRAFLARGAEVGQVLAELKKSAREAEIYQKAMDAILPAEEQLLDFRPWLNGIANSHGVRIVVTLRTKNVIDSQNAIGEFIFDMEVEGTYEKILSFLDNIEESRSRFLISIDTFELQKSANGYRVLSRSRVFFREKSQATPQ